MTSVFLIIFVTLYWTIPWNRLPALLRGLPWFLLAASFAYVGEKGWFLKLFLILGVGTTIYAVVRNLLNKSKDKNNEL